jgi:lysophospholipase L1-like esterase
MNIRLAALLAVLTSSSAFAGAADPLNVYASRPLDSWHIQLSDFETNKTLEGDKIEISRQVKVPESVVTLSKTARSKKNDALTLYFNQAWYASLRVDGGQPLDLRPYVKQGVLALDVNVQELSDGGISFKLRCGENCERNVPYLVPARAMAGKGWQHLVFSMNCFYREGDDFSAITQPFALEGSGSGKISVANIQYQLSGKPNASCPDYKTVSVTPDKLNESWSVKWWTKRHQDKLALGKKLGKSSQLLFIGDSITEGWEKSGAPVWQRNYQSLNALDLGFGGDRTENVLWRLQHGEVDGLDPQVIVLMLGTNNTGHRQEDPQTTAIGIKRNIDELQKRLPNSKILLLGIFPRGEKADDPLRQINQRVNALIAGFADQQKIYYSDIGASFLQPDGSLSKDIMPDLLHPNEKGYQIWAEAMAPTLNKLLNSGVRSGNQTRAVP